MKKIKTVCCLCGETIHDGPLSKEGLMSHGYCQRCFNVVMAFVKELKDERASQRKD